MKNENCKMKNENCGRGDATWNQSAANFQFSIFNFQLTIPIFHFAFLCLTSTTLAARARPNPPRAIPVEGPPFRAELTAADAAWHLTFTADKNQRTMLAADLVTWGKCTEPASGGTLVLADGGILAAGCTAADKEKLTIASDVFGTQKLPIHSVCGVVFHLPFGRQRRDALLDRIARAIGQSDRLLLANSDELTGSLVAIASDVVKLDAEVGPVEISTDRVTAIIFNPESRRRWPGGHPGCDRSRGNCHSERSEESSLLEGQRRSFADQRVASVPVRMTNWSQTCERLRCGMATTLFLARGGFVPFFSPEGAPVMSQPRKPLELGHIALPSPNGAVPASVAASRLPTMYMVAYQRLAPLASDYRRFAAARSTDEMNQATAKTNKNANLFRAWVGFRDGSRLLAREIVLHDGSLRILANGQTWNAPADRLIFLQPLGGRAVYLSDLKPAEYRQTPYLDLPWAYQADRNVTGGWLRCGGRLFLKGLGVHSTARLVYEMPGARGQGSEAVGRGAWGVARRDSPLPPGEGQKPVFPLPLGEGQGVRASRFCAEIGIDDSTAGQGSVHFHVLVDGQKKFTSKTIRGGDPPVPVSVDVTGAKRLELLVDYADRADVLDHADWLNVRLIVDSGTTDEHR